MRFIVFGAGAIGSIIGGQLARTGHEVVLIARGAHVDAINTDGLRLWRPEQTYTIRVQAFASLEPLELRPDDVVLLCVKGQHTAESLDQIADAMGTGTPLFCCQNGVVNEEVATARGFSRVYGVVVNVPGQFHEPGMVYNACIDFAGNLGVGCYPKGVDALAEAVGAALRAAGFRGGVFPNVMDYKWRKLLSNLSNAVSGATGGDGKPILELLRAEAWAVIRAAGIEVVPEETYRIDMDMLDRREANLPLPVHGSSTWQSLFRGTGNIEARQLNGYIADLATQHGVRAPANARITEIAEDMAAKHDQPGKYSAEELMEILQAAVTADSPGSHPSGPAIASPSRADPGRDLFLSHRPLPASAKGAPFHRAPSIGPSSLKITDVAAVLLEIPNGVPYAKAMNPSKISRSRRITLVTVTTESGLTGFGAAETDAVDTVRKRIAPQLIGKDAAALERHAPVIRAARAWLVDQALCDLVGKAAGQPLHRLWGAFRTTIPAYASTIAPATPQQRAEHCLRYLDQGFKAVKLRTCLETMRDDIRLVETVRDAVGDRMVIMVDANQASGATYGGRDGTTPISWDYRRAVQTARELERLDVYWLEEPLPRYHFDDLRRLCDSVDIPIVGGEGNEGLHEFTWMLQTGVYDAVQPDSTMSEGLSQLRKIAAMADMLGKKFIPHHGNTTLGLSAHLQLCGAIANCDYVEYMLDPPFRTIQNYQQCNGVFPNPVEIDADGNVAIPNGPGLGVEVDEAAVKAYAVG